MHPFIYAKSHRLPRECYRGRVVVAFTACIEGRHLPFRDETVVSEFVQRLREAAKNRECLVPIYCFMPDHVHVILQGDSDAADTWRAMVQFKQTTGFWFGQHRPQDIWQTSFYDHIIRVGEDLGAQIRYIADNPVRKGLVKLWSDYTLTGSIGVPLRVILADAATL